MHEDLAWLTVETLFRKATETIRKLQKELAEQKELADKSKWISVEERFPPIDKEVLVFAVGLPEWGFEGKTTTAIAYRFMYRFWNGGKEYEQWSTPWEHFHKDYKITHWMPLPEPPEEGGGEDGN